jgi:serine/threonine-protein kinase
MCIPHQKPVEPVTSTSMADTHAAESGVNGVNGVNGVIGKDRANEKSGVSGTLISKAPAPSRPPPPRALVEDAALIDGTYRVKKTLGEGAMGVALLAHDEQLQRDVAIKLLREGQSTDGAMQAKLLEEARAMARVFHPNVVKIHAFGEHEGAPYFVMEYVSGPTLEAYVRSRGGLPLDIDEALSLLDQICLGLSAIHLSGTTHRDLKPSNILIGPALRVAIADLGLAERVSYDGSNGPISFCGTPAFIAPEVALAQSAPPALMPRVDIYALGLIAYWLLTGQPAFTASSISELLKLHAYAMPAPPSAVRPELGAAFDAPVLAALAKKPEVRTASAEAFRQALFEARSESPRSFRSVSVLIADDDPAFRGFLMDVVSLALPGARIELAPDGIAALAAVERCRPTLGLFDLDMPGLNGVELTAAVRGLPSGGDFPIIVATGSGGASDWHKLSKLGASAFLVKPFDAGQLISLVRGLATADAPRAVQNGGR